MVKVQFMDMDERKVYCEQYTIVCDSCCISDRVKSSRMSGDDGVDNHVILCGG